MVTRHAKKRMRKRDGINSRAAERKARIAYEKGYSIAQTKGKLRKWMTRKYNSRKTADNLRVYGDKLYVFKEDTLITVLQIPQTITANLKQFIIEDGEYDNSTAENNFHNGEIKEREERGGNSLRVSEMPEGSRTSD